jgi:hypothetical protein
MLPPQNFKDWHVGHTISYLCMHACMRVNEYICASTMQGIPHFAGKVWVSLIKTAADLNISESLYVAKVCMQQKCVCSESVYTKVQSRTIIQKIAQILESLFMKIAGQVFFFGAPQGSNLFCGI